MSLSMSKMSIFLGIMLKNHYLCAPMKKVFKWIGITLAVMLGVVLLLVLSVPVLLYTPSVQDYLLRKALVELNQSDAEMHYEVGSLRLTYPLELELWDLCIGRNATNDSVSGLDTLAFVHHVKTALDEFPWQERTDFVVHQLLVEEVHASIDTAFVAGLDLHGSLDSLRVREVRLNLDSNRVSVGDILLERPHFDVNYASTDSTTEEETSEPMTPWRVSLGALDINDTHVGYDVYAVDSFDVHVREFLMEGMNFYVDSLAMDLRTYYVDTFDVHARMSGRWTEKSAYCGGYLAVDKDTLTLLQLTGRYDFLSMLYEAVAEVSHLDVMHYVPEAPVQDLCLRVEASGQALDTLQVHADIDCALPDWGDIHGLSVDFENSSNQMSLGLKGGDAQVDVEAGCDLNHLMEISDRVMKELDMQTTSQIFDINALQQTIPSLSVRASMQQENPLMPILKQYGVSFDAMQLLLTNSDSLRLTAQVDTLLYEGTRVAHVGARLVPKGGNYDYLVDVFYEDTITGMDFSLDVKARLLSDTIAAEGELYADTMKVLDFDACLTDRIHADFYLATMPLAMVSGFLPEDVDLKGYLNAHAVLDCDSIDFNALTAAVWFDSASVWYGGCDMTLGLPHDSIVYRDGQLILEHIRFLTANDEPISIDGRVDLRTDMANPDIQLDIRSRKAMLFDTKTRRSKEQFVVGTLPLTTAISVQGRPDDLHVTGTIRIPEGCNLTYFYEEAAPAVQSQLDDLVDFVHFEDGALEHSGDGALEHGGDGASGDCVEGEPGHSGDGVRAEPKPTATKLDVNLKLSVAPSTQIMATLPTGDEDQVTIMGGGSLKLSMDGNGKLQLSGGYDVTSGDIDFTLPMLPVSKQFTLTNDSWLRWSGIVDQPELNLKATEKVKCTINDASAGARVVRFVVSILIRGTLENMDIIFDCSAPDDAAIQSELASLTEEDRSKQALMLLIAQTYTGPSASNSSAGLSSANAAISSLVNKELESLLSGKLKHTEVNVDIDSYDATGTGSQQTDYSVSVTQKFFDDRMRVTVGGKMSTGDEVQQKESSIINDVSVEWLIRPDGSQYARVFRHTNYESVLEGEVVETGVGYVQKREARKFWHLFHFKKFKR